MPAARPPRTMLLLRLAVRRVSAVNWFQDLDIGSMKFTRFSNTSLKTGSHFKHQSPPEQARRPLEALSFATPPRLMSGLYRHAPDARRPIAGRILLAWLAAGGR